MPTFTAFIGQHSKMADIQFSIAPPDKQWKIERNKASVRGSRSQTGLKITSL